MSDAANGLERLLATMESGGASDLFITEGKPPAIRKNGAVIALSTAPTLHEEIEALLQRLLSEAQIEQFNESGDLDIGFSLDDRRRFRFNIARQRGRLGLVIRALPSGDLDFGRLRLPQHVARLADLPRGLVLVTGATGSGKSTTLAAMIHRINTTRHVHVVSIEDPIEFVHDDRKARVTQREVGSDTASFQSALRHVVRESPDVIVIGELRDYETMQVAVSAALTGHLVLATLHTIDATQTVQRILSYFPEHLRNQAAMDLSLSLEGIVAQRLLTRSDGKGRVVAVELLTCTPPVKQLVRDQRVSELHDLMRGSSDPGIMPFNQALLRLYQEGLITYQMGIAYATNPDEFALSARGMRTGVQAFRKGGAADIGQGLDLRALLHTALQAGASDLHLAVDRPPILRVSGHLQPLPMDPLNAADMRILLYSILSVRQQTTYELERELDFALQLDAGQRFRINAYHQKGQMAAALRSIPTEVPDAGSLGLPEQVTGLAEHPHGLLLVCGPTGSGKTTTLACLVDRINRTRACRVITVEDPIEYTHTSQKATIDQREVHADTKSFAAALKYVLRQDPDVILIGEMRDYETVGAALTAAETGHLVLATLHSNDAMQTIDRIIDVFPTHQQSQARSQLAAALLCVVSQRLMPRKDQQGRIAAFEVMMATPAIRNLIRENKMHQAKSLMEGGRGAGMLTMDRALRTLYEQDMVTFEDALRYVNNPNSLGAPPEVLLDAEDLRY